MKHALLIVAFLLVGLTSFAASETEYCMGIPVGGFEEMKYNFATRCTQGSPDGGGWYYRTWNVLGYNKAKKQARRDLIVGEMKRDGFVEMSMVSVKKGFPVLAAFKKTEAEKSVCIVAKFTFTKTNGGFIASCTEGTVVPSVAEGARSDETLMQNGFKKVGMLETVQMFGLIYSYAEFYEKAD